jgi:hypothetical protein
MEKEIKRLKGFKISDIVRTPHGKGTIVKFEQFRLTERVGVELENNPFSFALAYYFLNEIVL